MFYKMFSQMCSGKPIGAVCVFMTGNYPCHDGDVSFLLEIVVATVAFFAVVLLLKSLDVMFSFHR